MGLLAHYHQYGRAEGRRALPMAAAYQRDELRFAADKETIILVSHEASRTGAPILALNVGERLARKYNVITLLMTAGDLTGDFERTSARVICLDDLDRNSVELKYAVRAILQSHPIRYAIVNSFVSGPILPALAEAFVPSVTLIHEFPSYCGPLGSVRAAFGWTTEPVFSTDITADAFRESVPALPNAASIPLARPLCAPI